MPREQQADEGPLWRRIAWLAGLWLASVSALGALAWLIRLWLV